MVNPKPLPDIPVIHLSHGPHELSIADPRSGVASLGSRYIHGGYILEWTYDKEAITANPMQTWNPYAGTGLPEAFETGLGFEDTRPHDLYLRIGAGKVRRSPESRWNAGNLPLEAAVTWQVLEQSQDYVRFSCQDTMCIKDLHWSYRLQRCVQLGPDGPTVTTELELKTPWSSPILFFAHPFFAHSTENPIALAMPEGAVPSSPAFQKIQQDQWAFENGEGFCWVSGFWGNQDELHLHRNGKPHIKISPGFPLEKIVCFATPKAFSVEPYWSRGWMDGEKASWSITYTKV